jgi:hypothetical protein
MSGFEMRYIRDNRRSVENEESDENDPHIEIRLYEILKYYVSIPIAFGTPFVPWLETHDKFVRLLNQKLFKFYGYYIWLIIHFGFVLNIYLIIDSFISYEISEALTREANLLSKLVYNASAVVLINLKAEFGHKFIRSISKLKYLNNNESIEELRLFCFKLSYIYNNGKQWSMIVNKTVCAFMTVFSAIFMQFIMSFILLASILVLGTNDWMTFLNPISVFNIIYTAFNFLCPFMAFSQTLQFKFESLAKFTEKNTKKSDLSKEDFVVIKKW